MSDEITKLKEEKQNLEVEIQALRAKLDEIERKEGENKTRRNKAGFFLGKTFLWIFFGPSVYGKSQKFWDAWAEWLVNRKSSPPMNETRDLGGVLLARFTRVGVISAVLGFLALWPVYFLWVQANQLKRQNTLYVFEQTNRLRELFKERGTDSDEDGIRRPSKTTVSQVTLMAKNEKSLMSEALIPLLSEDDPAISLGAFHVLKSLNQLPFYLNGVNLTGLRQRYAKFNGVYFRTSELNFSELFAANFNSAILRETEFNSAYLYAAEFHEAIIRGSEFNRANLESAQFNDADLGAEGFHDRLIWRNEFHGANLEFAQFNNADLTLTQFNGANLESTKFNNAVLWGVDFTDAQNLRLEQLQEACVYDNTILPEYLSTEAHQLSPIRAGHPKIEWLVIGGEPTVFLYETK